MPAHAVKQARGMAIGLCLWLAGLGSVGAQSSEDRPNTAPLMPWLALEGRQPVQLTFRHEIEYDPAVLQVKVARSDWNLKQLSVTAFGGRMLMIGRGDIASGRPSDVQTTITLESIDVQSLLDFLSIPRANEVEGRVRGVISASVTGGEWTGVQLDLETETGTVRLSRGLIKEILGGRVDRALIAQKVDSTLDFHFGAGTLMIPIESMRLTGRLGEERLGMSIPIRNAALDIRFEPLVDRQLLWEIWHYLRRAGLRDVSDADWTIFRE